MLVGVISEIAEPIEKNHFNLIIVACSDLNQATLLIPLSPGDGDVLYYKI